MWLWCDYYIITAWIVRKRILDPRLTETVLELCHTARRRENYGHDAFTKSSALSTYVWASRRCCRRTVGIYFLGVIIRQGNLFPTRQFLLLSVNYILHPWDFSCSQERIKYNYPILWKRSLLYRPIYWVELVHKYSTRTTRFFDSGDAL